MLNYIQGDVSGSSVWEIDVSEREFSYANSINVDFAVGRRSSFLPNRWKELYQSQDQSQPKYVFKGATVHKLQGAKERVTKFCTGSKYVGNFNEFSMAGKGIYKFPHGVIYDGFFNKKGEFHGNGMLIYPGGQKVEGLWKNGKLVKGANFIANDNAMFEDRRYRSSDRRFQIEVENELNPAGLENLTPDSKPHPIPAGCYDMGEGFYNPSLRIILDYDDKELRPRTISDLFDEERIFAYKALSEISKSYRNLLNSLISQPIPRTQQINVGPREEIEQWIKRNCRKAWDEPTEYRPELYEIWTAGYRNNNMFDNISAQEENSDIMRYASLNSDTKNPPGYTFIKGRKLKYTKNNKNISISNLLGLLTLLGQNTTEKRERFDYSKCTIKNEISPSGIVTPVMTCPFHPKAKNKLLSVRIREDPLKRSSKKKSM